ncbi:MAG: PspA/IM30 family protein, partial [Candidatus Bipolaricaulota bacterium]
MGIFSRFKRVLKAKLSKGLNRLEDPAEQLDYAYEELMGERKKIEKAIRDVTADKNMIATALNEHQEAADEAHSKAKRYRRKALQL